jgi:hypothetical protein
VATKLAALTASPSASGESNVSSLPSSPSPSTGGTGVLRADAGPRPRRQTAPLSSAQLGAPLVDGAFVSACGAPDNMKVVANVTVKMGRATAVSVTTQPPDPAVRSCIERSMRDMRWDISPEMGRLTVRY